MATLVVTDLRPYLGVLDLTNNVEQVSFGDLTAEAVEFTNGGSGGFREFKPGNISGEMSMEIFQDFALLGPEDILGTAGIGTQLPFTGLLPGSSAAGDPCYLSRGYVGKRAPWMGAEGAAAKSSMTLPYDTRIVRGAVLQPSTARTTTGTGTAVALAGPSATQSLWATLHVFAYSGLTNIVVKVQTDDNGSFTSATDRITFTTVTGTTSQFTSVAGAFASETHARVSWTVSGTGSCTFAVAAGVL